jgi:hypothetical protein
MNKKVKIRLLICFMVAVFVITPLAVLYPNVTAITDSMYENEEGDLSDGDVDISDDYSGLGYGNAFDMFGDISFTQQATEPEVTTVQSATKQYQVAKKKNSKTPTEPGSKEAIVTTTTKPVKALLNYKDVGKNENVKGEKLRTLSAPSQASKNKQLSAGYLIAIKNPDSNYAYDGKSVEMTEKDLDIAGRLVMGEAGTMGFYGCCLVAQAIRDTYYYGHFKSIEAVRTGYGYDGKLKNKPNAAAKKAVKYILQEGHSVIQHRILYFYNPRLCASDFHEKQNYLLTYKDVRFFD